MYCNQCGTKNPDNARFCSSCGQKIVETVNPQQAADDFLNQLTPEQKDGLFKDMAAAIVAPIEDEFALYEKIAKNGPVVTDDVKKAIEWSESFKNSFPDSEKPSRLSPYVLADKLERLFRLRWYNREKISSKEVRKMLEDDWYLYVQKGMEGLLKTHTQLSESTTDLITWKLKGLAEWLEDECVKNLLLAIRLEKVNITKDSLAVVGISRLGTERFGVVTEYVASVMKTVK